MDGIQPDNIAANPGPAQPNHLIGNAVTSDPTIDSRLHVGYLAAQALHQQFYENHMLDSAVIKSVSNLLYAIDLLQTRF